MAGEYKLFVELGACCLEAISPTLDIDDPVVFVVVTQDYHQCGEAAHVFYCNYGLSQGGIDQVLTSELCHHCLQKSVL